MLTLESGAVEQFNSLWLGYTESLGEQRWFTAQGNYSGNRAELTIFQGAEQRWFTAQGNYSGSRAELTIFQTRNGVFDDPAEVSTVAVGTMVIEFTSCTTATLTYDLPEFGLSGTIPIRPNSGRS